MYYVNLALRDGTNLQQAIQMAKEIDQQSKVTGFNQSALDQMARQCFSNARFEVNSEEGLDLVEEFYTDEGDEAEQTRPESKAKAKSKFQQGQDFVQDIQRGLQGSVRAVN